jgi:hypothetical protein
LRSLLQKGGCRREGISVGTIATIGANVVIVIAVTRAIFEEI